MNVAGLGIDTQRPLLVVLDVPSDPKSAAEPKQLAEEGDYADVLQSYQLCRVDVSSQYGKKVAKAFGANEFPFRAIIDKTGKVILCKKLGKLSGEVYGNGFSGRLTISEKAKPGDMAYFEVKLPGKEIMKIATPYPPSHHIDTSPEDYSATWEREKLVHKLRKLRGKRL